MKAIRDCVRVSRWPVGILVVGIVVPQLVLASRRSLSSLAIEACKSRAEASYQKKSVEVEMASITGSLSSIELGGARESLQDRLSKEKARCQGTVTARNGVAEASSGAL